MNGPEYADALSFLVRGLLGLRRVVSHEQGPHRFVDIVCENVSTRYRWDETDAECPQFVYCGEPSEAFPTPPCTANRWGPTARPDE